MKYNNEKIIAIEYDDKKPFQVWTENGYYDFEPDSDSKGFMFYKSGGGKNIENNIFEFTSHLAFPKIPPDCQLWVDSKIILKSENIVGYEILKKPIRLKGFYGTSINPFHENVSREVFNLIYCKKCKKYYDGYGCDIHEIYENDDI